MGLYQKDAETHWLVGWEWHAHMWYVTPPELMDPQLETEWFFTYEEALEEVESQIRRAPVQFSVVDATPVYRVTNSEVNSLVPAYQPREPQRVISESEHARANRYGVANPIADQFDTPDRRGRLDDYSQSVGLR